MIDQGVEQNKRIERLNKIAKNQYDVLKDSSSIKTIEKLDA